jgi:hypothetical protein
MARTWEQKLAGGKPAHVEVLGKPFGGAPEGARMLITTPRLVDDYMRTVPRGERRTVARMKADLAAAHSADLCCPISTSIFARIAAEAALEKVDAGAPFSEVTPFWRVVEADGKIAGRLSCGPNFIRARREEEAEPAL